MFGKVITVSFVMLEIFGDFKFVNYFDVLTRGQMSAADVVNYLSEDGLCQVIKKYGEEKRARLIARAIVDSRNTYGKITTTAQLAGIVADVYKGFVSL